MGSIIHIIPIYSKQIVRVLVPAQAFWRALRFGVPRRAEREMLEEDFSKFRGEFRYPKNCWTI